MIGSRRNSHRSDVTSQPKKSTRRRRSAPRRATKAARQTAPPPAPPPPPLPPVDEIVPVDVGPPPDVPLAEPEVVFAARAAARPPEVDRPLPTTRRAIFFDVENTSRMQHIARVIDHLAVDRVGRRTDFVAVGNWRVIGHDTARLLASHGAQLLHSAPSTGVKDWSDLRIAVAAGVWLGTARPGDILEIITDDRAFDAVGDVATSLGIAFRRLSYRGLTGLPREAAPAAAAEPVAASHGGGGRHRRGRRGGRGRRGMPAPVHEAPPARPAPPPPPDRPTVVAEPHTAPHDELLGVARDLIQASPGRSVTLDALANALKARGFSRPPGSPRLITRLRRLRELSVSRSGHITLVEPGGAPPEPAREEPPAPVEAPMPAPPEPAAPEPAAAEEYVEDDRTYEERRADVEAAMRAQQYISALREGAPLPGQRQDLDPRRRRPRRGGRGFRRHGARASG